MRVAGLTVWLTGASSGIGAALAEELARRGATLILSARREAELAAVRARCTAPERHRLLIVDLADPASVAAAAAQAGPVDVLINNGGVSQRAAAAATNDAVDRRILEINYFAPVALSRAVVPGMVARGRGQIVVVSSLMGLFSTPLRSSYAASKHALHGYFDALRAEVHGQGVRVTLLCPGYVRTGISQNALSADGSAHATLDPGVARGADPAVIARRMANAIEADAPEVVLSWPGRLARILRAALPRFSFWLTRRLPAT